MGTDREFDALAAEAIASSEKEFFNEAMDQGDPVADESGDRSLEDMGKGLEGQHEDGEDDGDDEDDAPLEAKAEGDEQDANATRDDKGRFQPQAGKTETPAERGLRTELIGERDKRKSMESENNELKQRLAAIEARLSQPAPQPQAPQPKVETTKEEIPDRWTDPEGYDRYFQAQILKQVEAQIQSRDQIRVAGSFEEAKAKHGDAFTEAYRAADAIPADDPVAKQLVETIMRSANPGERLVAWHKQQQAQREIRADPVAYRERVAAEAREALMKDPEFRRSVLEGLQAEANGGNGNSPRSVTKLPPSLNSARGGSQFRAGGGAQSEADIFAETMS